MIYFTADEHHNHSNVIKFCNRPYSTVEEMNEALIANHNSVVTPQDVVYHLGDFCWTGGAHKIIKRLNGSNVLLRGNHDRGGRKLPHIKCKTFDGIRVVMCHYAMLTWPSSHHGSWQLFGHSHGLLRDYNKDVQYDVGVDNNNYYPVSLDTLKQLLLH